MSVTPAQIPLEYLLSFAPFATFLATMWELEERPLVPFFRFRHNTNLHGKEQIMSASRGAIFAHRLFSVHDLGFANPEPNIALLIRAFLKIGDAVAARWIEMPGAILLLQMAPEDPASGAIYIYDRRREEFYMICFEGEDDHLTVEDFEALLSEYGLLRYVEYPTLLEKLPPAPIYEPVRQRAAQRMLYAYVRDAAQNAGYILCFAGADSKPPHNIHSLLADYRLLWCLKVPGGQPAADTGEAEGPPSELGEAQPRVPILASAQWCDPASISLARQSCPPGLPN